MNSQDGRTATYESEQPFYLRVYVQHAGGVRQFTNWTPGGLSAFYRRLTLCEQIREFILHHGILVDGDCNLCFVPDSAVISLRGLLEIHGCNIREVADEAF